MQKSPEVIRHPSKPLGQRMDHLASETKLRRSEGVLKSMRNDPTRRERRATHAREQQQRIIRQWHE